MTRTPPTLSVLISTYDDRAHVDKKLAEIKAQTIFAEVEFLFIETASPGRERELLGPFCDAHPNCRLLTTDTRERLFAAWNRGWRSASGDWVCFSNMDDAMHPRLLERVRAYVSRHEVDLCAVLIAKQPDDDPERDSWMPRRFARLELSTRPGPFWAWRRSLREPFGMFEERFTMAGDKDFWSRAVDRRLRVGIVPRVLYLYTVGSGQLSKQGVPQSDADLMAAQPYTMRWPWRFKAAARVGAALAKIAPSLLVPR